MDSRLKIPLIASIMASVALLFLLISYGASSNKKAECAEKNMVYENGQCRAKTVSEQFQEKCEKYSASDQKFSSWIILGTASGHSCNEIRNAGLEKAFIEDNIVEHNKKMYEGGTEAEIKAGKDSGDYCLNAADTWNHIGEKRCVVFDYAYMACSGGYCFLDEKEDYKKGFVAFFGKYNMYTWNSFKNTYYGKGPILVCGEITRYQGHPQIAIYNVDNQTILNPKTSMSGSRIVYRYSCK